jgi:hypothetical protein
MASTPDDDKKDTLILPGGIGPIPEDPIQVIKREEAHRTRVMPGMTDILEERPPDPTEVTEYDRVMTFIRAQGAFIRAQSYFLEVGRNQVDDKDYIQHLTGFATAQAELIRAQQDFLKMFGAM